MKLCTLFLPLIIKADNYYFQDSLTKASRDGDLASVQNIFLNRTTNPNSADTWKKTPLHYAAEYGHADLLFYLYKQKADINSLDYRRRTPLLLAASKGNVEVVKKLLGIDINVVKARDEASKTALHLAAEMNHHHLIKPLSKLIDVNIKTITGQTPLISAAVRGNGDFIKVLIKAGADVNLMDNEGVTAIMHAAHMGHEDIVVLLKSRGARVPETDRNGRTLIHYSVMSGQTDMLRWMFKSAGFQELKPLVNAKDSSGKTALHYAAKYGFPQALTFLLHNQATIDTLDNALQTALHLAIKLPDSGFAEILEYRKPLKPENYECVDILLNKGANVGINDRRRYSPIARAVEYGCSKTIKRLIRGGANVNAKVGDKRTDYGLLHLAVDKETFNVIDTLLTYSYNGSHKIDILQLSRAKETPLMLAVKQSKYGAVEKFMHYRSNGRNVGIEMEDKANRSPLSWACLSGKIDLVKLLIANGANVNAHFENKQITPLHYAAGAGNQEVVKLLLKMRADISAKDESGSSALDTATYYNRLSVVKVLLSNKFYDTVDKLDSAYNFAVQKNYEELIKIFNDKQEYIKSKEAINVQDMIDATLHQSSSTTFNHNDLQGFSEFLSEMTDGKLEFGAGQVPEELKDGEDWVNAFGGEEEWEKK